MKVQTSELIGAALDWAVAKCEYQQTGNQASVLWLLDYDTDNGYSPSTNWAQGGPIIEKYKFNTFWQESSNCWVADLVLGEGDDEEAYSFMSPTPLIAAMRCYVASKLGDEVEVPDELL